jgi:porin
MKIFTMIVAVMLLLGVSLSAEIQAQETSPANPYSGDFWSRSTLTGDWGGARNDLAKKGVTFDLSLTQAYQGIVSGGKERVWHYGGHGDLNIHVDTQKLGLWPGGFFNAEVEGNYNNSVNGEEAWSFANAKVPKSSASEWSRWSE